MGYVGVIPMGTVIERSAAIHKPIYVKAKTPRNVQPETALAIPVKLVRVLVLIWNLAPGIVRPAQIVILPAPMQNALLSVNSRQPVILIVVGMHVVNSTVAPSGAYT